MNLPYDPGAGASFWASLRHLPGYPTGETVVLREMIFESDALLRLPTLVDTVAGEASALLVVMDGTIMRRAGDELKPLVLRLLGRGSRTVIPLVLKPDASGQVHTTMLQIEAVKARLNTSMAVIAVGAGTVTDIAKHACYLFEGETGRQLPFVVYQTANSVSAFTSNMAPVFLHGVKRTLPSRYPNLLICDLETLRDAPYAMTAAGVGDLLAAFVSLPDWYLAHRLGLDESYTRFPQTLMGPLDTIFLAAAEAIRTRSLEGMAVLSRLIALAGLAMSLAHATTPLSGFEHVMSHMLDLLAEQAQRPLAQHGAQVAMATLTAAAVYRDFLTEFDPALVTLERCYPPPALMQQRIEQTFRLIDPSGHVGTECWADYRLKLEAWHAHQADFSAFMEDWPAIRGELASLTRPPEQVAAILRAVAAPLSFAELEPPVTEPDARFAFLNAPLMRRRFTIGDLMLLLGWDEQKLWRYV
jgi:glycerol-1-phosphate dehydrogenase [NAD(P)+]